MMTPIIMASKERINPRQQRLSQRHSSIHSQCKINCRSNNLHLLTVIVITLSLSSVVTADVTTSPTKRSQSRIIRSALPPSPFVNEEEKDTTTQPPQSILTPPPPSSSSSISFRGGSSPSSSLRQKEISGILFFTILDISLRSFFSRQKITFPSMMAGCVALFAIAVIAESVAPGMGDGIYDVLSPGANVLARWMSVFFVPGVAMLPTAPSLGSGVEVVKVGSIIILGFLFSLLSTAYSVAAVRTIQGKITSDSNSASSTGNQPSTPSTAPPKPYSPEILRILMTGSLILFPLSILTHRTSHPLSTPIQTLFMLCVSVGSYVYGARLPRTVTKIIHPLIIATVSILSATKLTAQLTNRGFIEVLHTYKANSLNIKTAAGAGDLLLFMLGPAVVSLSMAMYSRKALMAENFVAVFTGVTVSAVGGLFGTAGYLRLISLRGSIIRRSVLSRNVTTALAMAITKILEGNTSVAACCVVIGGIIGATYAARIMTALGITDPVARGLGMGSAAQGLGAASMIGEVDAFPFAAMNMILTAVAASTLVSIPWVREILLSLALGSLKEEAG